MKCNFCGTYANSFSRVYVNDKPLIMCTECRKKKRIENIENDLKGVTEPYHFRGWKKEDMSEAFWLHLGRYKKKPNRKSLDIMYIALLWAYHDDHGLSNSFTHALKWCGIDLFTEKCRRDLPETDMEDTQC